MSIGLKYSVEYAEGVVDIDEESIREAFAEGGAAAVDELLQEELDTYVRNNVCAVVTDAAVAEVLAKLGLS